MKQGWFATAMVCLTMTGVALAQQEKAAPSKLYNTTKQKLLEGKQVVCATISSPEPDAYCATANSGFDCTWIEMQHSVLMYDQVAAMIRECPRASATPMIRVPDATEGDIQKATDLGALGIILPMVDDPEKAKAGVKFAKYPPIGRRSQGGGQYGRIWGREYRQTANENIMVIAMIESPEGVANAAKIAAVPGVDVVFAASSDLGSFSGYAPTGADRKGNPQYEALVTKIHDETLAAGKKLGGPFAWRDRHGYTFFQGPGPSALISAGAPIVLGRGTPATSAPRRGGPLAPVADP